MSSDTVVRQTPHLLRYHLLGVLCWLYPVGYPRIEYYGPGPHWGTVRKKMSPGKVCKSCVLRSIYTHTVYNDYYFQIIIEVAQLRQHKQRLNDLRTQLG